jgi:CRP-like cAMP-binding protein
MGCGGSKANTASDSGGGAAAGSNNRDQDKKAAKEENKDFAQTMGFLTQVPLFKRLPKDQHPLLAAACIGVEFQSGKQIITQGDNGNEFFVIRSGEASVLVGGNKVATLKTGDYFGENALLRDEPRTATICAEGSLSAFKITRDKFQELGLNEKLQFANRKAVGAGGGQRTLETKAPTPKNEQERTLIASALRKNENLQTMVTLDDERVNSMIDAAWKENVAAGKELITEGDLNADYFYVVQEGSFEIYFSEQLDSNEAQGQSAEKAVNRGESKFVSAVTQGGSFGELALLYLVPRAATVKAKVDSVVWVIDRQKFKAILMKVSDEKISEYVKYLDRVEILAPLLGEEKKALAQALIEMHFTKGEIILQQGEPGNTFYILYDGEVSVIKDNAEQTKLQASPSRQTAQFFGERALMNSEPRAATVRVVSSTAKALALDRDSFNMLLGPLEDLIKRTQDKTSRPSLIKPSAPGQSVNPNDKPRDKILRKDLQKIGLLGCGGFGAVELWEHKKTGETYAMKGLSKGYIVKTGMQDSVMNEKNILMMTNSPFIVKLYECYNGSQTLYFLMEPALGGELYATYNRKGFHGSEKHARFYVAGTVYAFEHCHERRIIYRDLKPENLLLNENGQVKVTDMGLAKFVIGKTYTTCGTPDYFAPELIASTGHTNAVDWWTLGILTFELMSGHPPFESAYPMQIYSKVMKGISKVPFPPKCQGPVGDLIKALLKKEPSERLPMRPGGLKNFRDHAWYKGFNWDEMKGLTLDPPYKPVVKSKKDIANFSARKEDMPRQIEYKDDGSGWDKEFAT